MLRNEPPYMTFDEIGAIFKCHKSTAMRMVDREEERLHAIYIEKAELIKVSQTHRLEIVGNDALREWERSKKDATSSSVKSSDGTPERGPSREFTENVKGQCGDAGLLAQWRGCMADIRKIWGAEAPEKIASTTPDGRTASIQLIEIGTREEATKFSELLTRIEGTNGRNGSSHSG